MLSVSYIYICRIDVKCKTAGHWHFRRGGGGGSVVLNFQFTQIVRWRKLSFWNYSAILYISNMCHVYQCLQLNNLDIHLSLYEKGGFNLLGMSYM